MPAYYALIDSKYYGYAFPTANCIDGTAGLTVKSITLIQLVVAEGQIIEIAAMALRKTGPPAYFHKLIQYTC